MIDDDRSMDSEDIELRGGALPECETILLETSDVESARAKAAQLWNISEADLADEVVESSSRLFGLLGKKLKVRVTSTRPIMYLQARDFVREVASMCGMELEVDLDDDCMINIHGDDSAIIIGRHGDTLKAFEFLTNLIYRQDQTLPKIRFDCGGYKTRREESLIKLARSAARDAARRGTTVRLEPMSSWERRIIHMALKSTRGVKTVSEGAEPNRYVAVVPAGTSHGRSDRSRRPRHPRPDR